MGCHLHMIGMHDRREKKEPNSTRATMGSNLIHNPEDIGTNIAVLLLMKIIMDCVISTPQAWFMRLYILNFHLMMPLKWPEFTKIKMSDILDAFTNDYNLLENDTPDVWVNIWCYQGMYGLPHAGSLGHDLYEEQLNKAGYKQNLTHDSFNSWL